MCVCSLFWLYSPLISPSQPFIGTNHDPLPTLSPMLPFLLFSLYPICVTHIHIDVESSTESWEAIYGPVISHTKKYDSFPSTINFLFLLI